MVSSDTPGKMMSIVPRFREIDANLDVGQGVVILIYQGAEAAECAVSARRFATEWLENAPLSIAEAVEWARDRAMMFDCAEILVKLDTPGLWHADWGPLD